MWWDPRAKKGVISSNFISRRPCVIKICTFFLFDVLLNLELSAGAEKLNLQLRYSPVQFHNSFYGRTFYTVELRGRKVLIS